MSFLEVWSLRRSRQRSATDADAEAGAFRAGFSAGIAIGIGADLAGGSSSTSARDSTPPAADREPGGSRPPRCGSILVQPLQLAVALINYN